MNYPRFEPHSHTDKGSNIRLIDSINKIENLVDYAIEQGLYGIAITDHECLSVHIKANQYAEKIKEKNPNFKIALGNEIYLTKNREKNQKYYHFILIAKNKLGHKALRELSSQSWIQSYWDRGMERVPTTYKELENILNKYPNSLIGSTACLGGHLSSKTLELINAEKMGDKEGAKEVHDNIVNFILWCKKIFKEDFYIECAPGCSYEQIKVNQRLISIAKAFNIKMIIGTDAHFLKKEDRYVHESYLNSKEGEREVGEFYQYAYLQTEEEIFEHLKESFYDEEFIKQMFDNSIEIYDKIENYSLAHKQTIPKVQVRSYEKKNNVIKNIEKYPTLFNMYQSEDIYERYWVNQCMDKLKEIEKDNETYIARLEEEANVKKVIGQKLETNMFAYPITLQHYIDLFWECGSIVGAGRGSSCSGLNHYLLGITQLDPIEWSLPWWRYLNPERAELGDIDLDLCPSKRPLILQRIKEERGKNFKTEIDNLSRKNLGCTLIATFGTETSKSAVLSACRGYRSEEYPDGIDNDIGQYMSSLIPSERGFVWSLHDVMYGNSDKDRKPVTLFINEVNQYPGLIDIMFGIEGMINKRSSHASGVILFDEDPYEFCCFMKTPKGEIITQWDLHECEWTGLTKYDFLVTEVQDKIAVAINLLQKYGEIEKDLTLKEVYNKYFHPSILPIEDKNIWKKIQNVEVLDLFQFDSAIGRQGAKKVQPKSMIELADANGLIRLMPSDKGAETPLDKYVRHKNNIKLWYDEMTQEGLTKQEQQILEPYFLSSYGVPPSQEQMMQMLMDKNICNFSLKEANEARKIVAKKVMTKIPELHQKVLDRANRKEFGEYVWKYGLGPQMGYSFSVIHALAYSFIGFQTAYLATRWNSIYWNTACLIVNSGSLEENEEYEIDAETENIVKKTKGTDYKKLAKALGDIISQNIKVSLIDINKSGIDFEPDIKNDSILFGLKALSGINKEVIDKIISNRPYKNIKDFMKRCPLNKTAMISLIKSGAFENIDKEWASNLNIDCRKATMIYYLMTTCDLKKKINLQNLNGLIQNDLIPSELNFYKRLFFFNKYLKTQKVGVEYFLNEKSFEFYSSFCEIENLRIDSNNYYINQKIWDKIYTKQMDIVRDWMKTNQEQILNSLNSIIFKKEWDKYALGNLSKWEMDSLCFYYNKHELINLNKDKYGVVDFNILPYDPEIETYFKRNKVDIPIYKIRRIAGTVISKDDNRHTIYLLTTVGVIPVKFTKDSYAIYNRQISEKQPDGTKKVIEKGWTTKGTKLLCVGFRREDTWVLKTYKSTNSHQLYKIDNIDENGNLKIISERAKGD